MAKLNKTRTIAAALLGTAVLGAPITSYAQDFRTTSNSFAECKIDDRNNQVVGGLIGAVAGGVFGSQVSGNGARTEGSIIGAALGAAAGASIADSRRNCRTEVGFTNTSSRNFGTTRVANTRVITTRGFNNRNIIPARTVSFGHNNRFAAQKLNKIEREIYAADVKIEKLVHEEKLLKKKLRYTRNTRTIKYRLLEIDDKIDYLKGVKRELKRDALKIKGGRY